MESAANTQGACIVVFVRCPIPGRVKSRLAAGVGPDAACDFYRACANYTLQLASRCPAARAAVYYSNADSEADIREWVRSLGLQDTVLRQQSPDPCLGAKMRHALEHELAQPGTAKALVVGSDIPGLSSTVLESAVEALCFHEMVVGPAVDGGYYLLGVRGPHVASGVFEGIEWSTPSVLSRTMEKAAAAGLRVAPADTLPVLRDVDTVDDLREWIASAEVTDSGTCCPSVERDYREALLRTVLRMLGQSRA